MNNLTNSVDEYRSINDYYNNHIDYSKNYTNRYYSNNNRFDNQFNNQFNNQYNSNYNNQTTYGNNYPQQPIPLIYNTNPIDKYKNQIRMMGVEILRLKSVINSQEEKLNLVINSYEDEIHFLKSSSLPNIQNVTSQVQPIEQFILEPEINLLDNTSTTINKNSTKTKSSVRAYKSSNKIYKPKNEKSKKDTRLTCGICQDDKVYSCSIDLKTHRDTHDNREFIATLPDDMKCVECVKAFVNVKGKHIHEGRFHNRNNLY